MIAVSRQRDLISRVERERVPWPSTISRLAPDWGEDLRCSRNGKEVPRGEWGEVLAEGDFIHFYTLPGLIPLPFSVAVVAFLNQVGLAIALSIISRLLMPSKKPNKRDEEDSANNGFANLQSNDRFEGVPMLVIYGEHRVAGPVVNQVVRTSLDGLGNPVSEVSLLILLCDGQIQAVGDKLADGGPFSSEDGTYLRTLQINNQPGENFEDIEAHVRLGTDEQEAISGFANPATQYGVAQDLTFPRELHKTTFPVIGAIAFSGGNGYTDGGTVTLAGGTGTPATFRVEAPAGVPIGLTLLSGGSYSVAPPSPNTPTGGGGSGLSIEPSFDSFISAVGDSASDPSGGTNTPGSNTAIAQPGSFAPTSTNITKWENFGTPLSYTMGEDADEFAALISMPNGLGNFTGANPVANTVAYQVRYRQVDAIGVPFGNYIVLDAERISLARGSAFQIEFRRRFYNPGTYAAPTFGQFLRGRTGNNGSTNRGASVTPNAAAIPVRSKPNSDFSFACWQRTNAVVGANSGDRCLFNWLAANKGMRFDVYLDDVGTTRARFRFGNGTSTVTLDDSDFNIGSGIAGFLGDTTNWKHFVLTYDGDGGNATSGQVRIYIDGVLRFTKNLPGQIEFDTALALRVQSDSVAPTAGYNCDMDEPTLWGRALNAFDVARLYNSRAPLSTAADAFGLLLGGRFDGTSGTTGLLAFGPAASANWVLGDGTGGASPSANPDCSAEPTAENGIVKGLESGSPLRGRFLVEIQRLTVEDSQAGLLSAMQWETIELATYQDFCFPGCALLALKARASNQLSGGAPLVTVVVKGRLVPVWDGVDPDFPNFVPTWSANPAWVACDILLSQEYGLGNLYGPRDIDAPAFQELADYCDELIYDNETRLLITEARQIEAADNANLPAALEGGAQDFIRYKVSSLAPNWPQPGVVSGLYMKPKITGNPSAPAWLTTEAGATAQEIRYVEYVASGSGFFYVWCNSSAGFGATGSAFTPGVSTTNYVEIEVHDVRYRYDGVFDRADVPAWEAVIQVLQTARAVPIKLGRRVSVFVDKPSEPVALICMGNIIEGSFSASAQGIADRPNVEQGEFFDRNLNYERSFVTDELPTVTDPSRQSAFNFRRLRLEGITRRGQAKRHLRRDLNNFLLLRKMKSFKTGINGLPLMPGDVLALAHDVVGYGFSGRLFGDSANQTSVKLDRPVTILPAVSYQVRVENAASNAIETKPITSGAGTYAAGAALTVGGGGFTFQPDENDAYTFGELGKDAQLYRVIDSRLDPQTLRRSIKALEYNEDVYDDDFGTLPSTSPTSLPVPSAPTIPAGVENLVVDESVGKGPDGSARIAALISFSHDASTFHSVASADVYVSIGTHDVGRAGAEHVLTLTRDRTSARIEYPFERNVTYTLWVVPRSVSGATYRVHASYSEFTPRGLAELPPPPASPRLAVVGEAAIHEWDDADGLDHGAVVEVRQGGWILGVPVSTTPAQARRSAPTPSWASAPTNGNGAETPSFYARTKSRTGQFSEVAEYVAAPSVGSDDGRALAVNEEDGW